MVLDNYEQRFQIFVRSVTDYAICILDTEGNVVSWNEGAERITGYSAEEIVGSHFSRFYTEEDQRAGKPGAALQRALKEGKFKEEGLRLRKDGETFEANVIIDSAFDDAGNLLGFAKITRDVTERRDLERQLAQAQKMEAVGQLAGGIAHDFNNILAVVVGNLDLLMELVDDDKQIAPLASSALEAALKGAETVRQLLAFSRKQTLQALSLDLQEILHKVEPLLRRAVGERISLTIEAGENLWPVMADPGELESVLLNLVINSRDAMPSGGKLGIRCSNVHLDEDLAQQEELSVADYVALTVNDGGSGIPRDILDRVFDPFFSTKEVGEGSGLGLSMVYGFARQSGGTAKIYSEVGHGTEVRVYLPRATKMAVGAEGKSSEMQPEVGHETVLVVEDRDDVRSSAVTALRSLGYKTLEAANAQEALAMLDAGVNFDLLFTDVVMPGEMTGIDLAWVVRRRRPKVPIVITSGFSDPDVIGGDLSALGASLIAKPYRKLELARELREAIDCPR